MENGSEETGQFRAVESYDAYLRQIAAIQDEIRRRLGAPDRTPPLDVAAMFEDVANIYLDMCDEIRETARDLRPAEPPSVTQERHAEEPPA